jgi:hypothetical protein
MNELPLYKAFLSSKPTQRCSYLVAACSEVPNRRAE